MQKLSPEIIFTNFRTKFKLGLRLVSDTFWAFVDKSRRHNCT